MSTQTINGRAFEWAVGSKLSELTGFVILDNSYKNVASNSFESTSNKKQELFIKAASKAVSHIVNKESKFLNSSNQGEIVFNSDAAGQKGDVRDVLINVAGKTIGISCKTNHQALKHSRLSGRLNFVKKWNIDENGCSEEYWNKVKPIFQELKQIRDSSQKTKLWSEIENKAEKYYWPLLNAWHDEIQRICDISEEKERVLCSNMIAYLIGRFDFYKVICQGQKSVDIQAYNFNQTLSTRTTKYPTCINKINKKNGGQYSKTIVFNNGFSINFRIHSASSRVEPSLKFDINAIGLPTNQIYQQTFDL